MMGLDEAERQEGWSTGMMMSGTQQPLRSSRPALIDPTPTGTSSVNRRAFYPPRNSTMAAVSFSGYWTGSRSTEYGNISRSTGAVCETLSQGKEKQHK